MKYLGNYKHLIDPAWIELLLSTPGTPISPWKDHTSSAKKQSIDLDQTLVSNKEQEDLFDTDGVYGDSLIMAEMFNKDNLPFELDLKELNYLLGGDWWFVKQLPGQLMPIHRDTPAYYDDNIRIWMPWLDYDEGHIFIHEGKFINDYKAGDIFKYVKDNDLHGSVNIGLTPRLILQISQKVLPYDNRPI